MKKIEMVIISRTNAQYHANREKLRHPRHALNLQTKHFIGADQSVLFISQS